MTMTLSRITRRGVRNCLSPDQRARVQVRGLVRHVGQNSSPSERCGRHGSPPMYGCNAISRPSRLRRVFAGVRARRVMGSSAVLRAPHDMGQTRQERQHLTLVLTD
jgi:hypothetical protein